MVVGLSWAASVINPCISSASCLFLAFFLFYTEILSGDKLYRQHNWKGACDAYCEALKRDPSFLSAVCNRAACWLRLHSYPRAIEDSSLALNMISNAPASSSTAEKYRFFFPSTSLSLSLPSTLPWLFNLRRGLVLAEALCVCLCYHFEAVQEDTCACLWVRV